MGILRVIPRSSALKVGKLSSLVSSVQPRTLYHCSCHCPDIYTTPSAAERSRVSGIPTIPRDAVWGREGGEGGRLEGRAATVLLVSGLACLTSSLPLR